MCVICLLSLLFNVTVAHFPRFNLASSLKLEFEVIIAVKKCKPYFTLERLLQVIHSKCLVVA